MTPNTSSRYTKLKVEFRRVMDDMMLDQVIDEHDPRTDLFAKMDGAMRRARRLASRHVDDDTLVVKEVEHLLGQTKVPVSERDLIFHMDHVILIRFGRMVQRATLTFTKYNKMKDAHREKAVDEVKFF